MLGLVVAGLVLRIAVLASPLGAADSDEAVVGLMARDILHGRDLPTFFPGQAYGGTLEAYVAAVTLAATPSVIGLKLVPVGLAALSAVLVWRVGLRTTGRPQAAMAAGVFWVFPAAFLWWSTRIHGFYWSGTVLGLSILLLALRLVDSSSDPRAPRRDWALLGLAAGLGWWQTPEIVFFAAPAGLWLLVRAPRSLRGLPWAVLPALLGAAPWLAHNVGSGFPSLRPLPDARGGYLDHIGALATRGLPLALGLRAPATEAWLNRPVGVALTLIAVGWLLAVRLARRDRPIGLLLLGAALFPLIYGLLPSGCYIAEGRYLVPIAPYLALLLTAALRRRVSVALVAVALVVTTAATLPRLQPVTQQIESSRYVPADAAPLLAALHARGIDLIFADYWIAYRVGFESGQRVLAAPLVSERRPDDTARVRAGPASWVFVDGSNGARTFALQLAVLGVPSVVAAAGGFLIVTPARQILPEQLPPVVLPAPEPVPYVPRNTC